MEIKTAEQYQAYTDGRSEWSKVNDYEVFEWCLCLNCSYFKIDTAQPISGDCGLMEQEGVYSGVLTQAVCNRYLSKRGTDINGKVLNPAMLPPWVKTHKDKSGSVFVVYETEKQELARHAKEEAAMKIGKPPAA